MAMIITESTPVEVLVLADVWAEYRDVLDSLAGALQSGESIAPSIAMLSPGEWKKLLDKSMAILCDGGTGLDSPVSVLVEEMNKHHELLWMIYGLFDITGFLEKDE